ncbi:LysR family transcriptional regulator [Pectobacterium wasabiae]|uniref:LysR family transcriptional regulator n=1 Tax=Pectobacterium wasabiae TaxID=55208 RepID=A0AAW3ENU9_9GAMM|nr:LysR family transcriptional regulator [Pectobacterium wasabiae]AOR65359.1 LysR family transcriptional regulator [Pectobacterium wasabiae CFBP 3304]EJS95774.1 Putative OprD regulatory protein [Pectobacterium wasabiae CFBP 3304]KFX09382.1 LysR family transcriptional regulator [Pectobacterium wasabiae]KGA29584.1 LysR family transcriptional regulator [Pectobacterium wasabiae]
MKSHRKNPTFSDLKAFIAIAEQKSFRRAADFTGITRSALSHAIRNLEAQLQIRLLHRTTRSIALTEAGHQLLQRISPHITGLEQALHEVADTQGQVLGTLRINGGEEGISQLIGTFISEYQARYPLVELDLVVDGTFSDIVAEGFDAGIRLADDVPMDMIAVRLSEDIRFLAVASPDYLATHPAPQTPEELAHHHCIRQRLPSGKRFRWEFSQHGQDICLDVPGTLTLNTPAMMIDAAKRGMGIAYVAEVHADAALRHGELLVVLEPWSLSITGLSLYFPANRHMPASLRALVDMIKARYPASEQSLLFQTESRKAR